MTEQIDLNWCSKCGGALKLVDGTDPDVADQVGAWEETYKCRVCDSTGTYSIGVNGQNESATGVVA